MNYLGLGEKKVLVLKREEQKNVAFLEFQGYFVDLLT